MGEFNIMFELQEDHSAEEPPGLTVAMSYDTLFAIKEALDFYVIEDAELLQGEVRQLRERVEALIPTDW